MKIVVILLLSALTYANANGLYPEDWIHVQGSCFKFVSESLTWSEAKSACEDLGSMIAVVNSEEKQDAIAAADRYQWIGLHRYPADTSQWLWVDGSPLYCQYWDDGEPDNHKGEFEGCGEMYRSGVWNDYPCEVQLPYVCEIRVCSAQEEYRKKREKLKLNNVYVKKGFAPAPFKKSADGSTA